MFEQQLTNLIKVVDQEDALLEAIEAVLAQYQEWKNIRLDIQTQIALDFHSLSLPTQEWVSDALHHFGVFAIALRRVADQLEKEVEETTDQFYDWLYD